MTSAAVLPQAEADALVVPGYSGKLMRVPGARKRALRAHLRTIVAEAMNRGTKPPPDKPRLPEDVDRVVQDACAICRGHCCRNGGDDAYLDDATIGRVMSGQPAIAPARLLQVYVARVPSETYAGSCIFHGARGCCLDRALRSKLCNDFYCNDLVLFIRAHPAQVPTNLSFVRRSAADDRGTAHPASDG